MRAKEWTISPINARSRGPACAEALVLAYRIAEELAVPVFLYGELTACNGNPGRSRAELRRGGVAGLARRLREGGEGHGEGAVAPDFGPAELHPTAGATLVAAREPLVAFNLVLPADAGLDLARSVAASIALTVSSRSVTTPLRSPVDGASPIPRISSPSGPEAATFLSNSTRVCGFDGFIGYCMVAERVGATRPAPRTHAAGPARPLRQTVMLV